MEIPELLPKLDRLRTLLEDYDGAAVELVSAIESQVTHTEFAGHVRRIGELADDFEFDEALERVNTLRDLMLTRMSDSAPLT